MSEMYDHELEKKILAVIGNASSVDVSDARLLLDQAKLRSADFHLPAHCVLFEATEALLLDGKPVDPVTIKGQLKSDEGVALAGGWNNIVDIFMGDHDISTTAFGAYAQNLKSMSLRRRVAQELGTGLIKIRSALNSPEEVLSEVTGSLSSIHTGVKGIKTLRDVLGDVATELDEVQSGNVNPVVPTGISLMDSIVGGVQPTLTVIGALPGVGKSALAATVVRNLARANVKVGIISLEDESSWLCYRILSHESGVAQFKLRFKRMNQYDLERTGEAYGKLHGYGGNVVVYDGSESGMTFDDVVGVANDMVVNHGCKLVMVDHIGEILTGHSGAAEDSKSISLGLSRLRGIANRHKIGMWAFMHLRRRDGLGPGDQPNLTDFASSAGAERKARVAIGLCREQDSDTLGICVLKQTWGKAGVRVNVEFQGSAAMIKSIEGNPIGQNEPSV